MHFDHSSIENLIPNNLIKSNIENLVNAYKARNIIFPFNHSSSSLPDFYENIRFTLVVKDNKMFITYKIPVFERTTLQIFHPKPILYNATIFLLQTESQFVIFDSEKSIIFNENALDENCFDYNNAKFCYRSNFTNECDSKYVNLNNITEIDPKCFKRLPEENIATQFSKDIFFTIVKPTTIHLTCGNKNTNYLLSSSKVLRSSSDCLLKKSFFDYNQHPTEFYYKIHFSHTDINKIENKNKILRIIHDKHLIQWYPILVFIIFVLTVIIIFILYLRSKNNNRQLNDKIYFHVSTKAVDTEV